MILKEKRLIGFILLFAFVLTGCYKPGPGAEPWKAPGTGGVGGGAIEAAPTSTLYLGEAQITENPLPTPTPNPTIVLPTPRVETISYSVQPGDTLKLIAQRYQVSWEQIVALNNIINPNLIEVGQVLLIPPPSFEAVAPSFKIIPDSELVNSPSNAYFNVRAFVNERNGFLAAYSEPVDGSPTMGAEIVERVALEYSVNPRLLLALLEYQSNWVTKSNPPEETQIYPLRYYEAWREGLYNQLAWAANLLNEGYYLWKLNAITAWILSDGSVMQVDPTINPGTAGVLNVLRYLKTQENWEGAVSEEGIYAAYLNLFGYPFIFAYEPMIPGDLAQPDLQLPFEKGDVWSFTGGPHGGWDTGSAWAAIDFAPPGEALGCFPSEAWVVASAPGKIVYSDHGAVIQDLDGDGVWQTGWSMLYMHIASSERVEVGEYLDAGDRIGHPSCEGGFSTGTHLHLARRYNGEWIAADSNTPMDLDGWITAGYGVEYDGYLIKGDETLEAWNGRSPFNAIQR
ncbi:MAG TPA: LysM peptidoglycan-binding domain-containing protein [Brevefilum sp.]